MRHIIDAIDGFNEWLGRIASRLVLLMAIVLFAIVVLRYGFNIGRIWLQELITYAHATFFMLVAAYTLKENGHVRIDVLYRVRSEKYKTWINLSGSVFLLLPTCLFIFFFSLQYVIDSWSYLETSREPGGLPFVFALKSVILIFSASLFLQCVAEIFRNILTLRDQK